MQCCYDDFTAVGSTKDLVHGPFVMTHRCCNVIGRTVRRLSFCNSSIFLGGIPMLLLIHGVVCGTTFWEAAACSRLMFRWGQRPVKGWDQHMAPRWVKLPHHLPALQPGKRGHRLLPVDDSIIVRGQKTTKKQQHLGLVSITTTHQKTQTASVIEIHSSLWPKNANILPHIMILHNLRMIL